MFASDFSLTQSDSFAVKKPTAGLLCSLSLAQAPLLVCTAVKEEEEEGGEGESPSAQVAAITHALFMGWNYIAFTGF